MDSLYVMVDWVDWLGYVMVDTVGCRLSPKIMNISVKTKPFTVEANATVYIYSYMFLGQIDVNRNPTYCSVGWSDFEK